MRPPPIVFAALATILLASACKDECSSVSPSFELDVRSTSVVRSIEVIVAIAGDERTRVFNVANFLEDGETSLAIELDDITGDFDVDITVTGYSGIDADGFVVATAASRFSGSPDGCNRFRLDLAPSNGDGGLPDSGPVMVCDPVCGGPVCTLGCQGDCSVCNLDCAFAVASCAGDCTNGTCVMRCESASSCEAQCNGGSTCEVFCSTASDCTAKCNGGANCLLHCESAGNCGFSVCAGGQTTCADGSVVCNRACP